MSRIICNSCGFEAEGGWTSASGEATETCRISVWGSARLIVTPEGLVEYSDFDQEDQDYIDTIEYEFDGVEEYECPGCGSTARDPNEIFAVMVDGCTCTYDSGALVTGNCSHHHGTTEVPKDGNPEDEVVLPQHAGMPSQYRLSSDEEFVWTGENRQPRTGEYFEVNSGMGVGIAGTGKWSPSGDRRIFVKRVKVEAELTDYVPLPEMRGDGPAPVLKTKKGETLDMSHMVPPPLPDPEEAPGDPELESIEEELDPDVNFVVRDVR